MDKNAFNYFNNTYRELKEVYNIPTIKTNFYQKDLHAKEYCDKIDFVTLIIPFIQESEDNKYKSVLIKNELVSYIDMYSEIYGTTVDENTTYIESAISIAKKYTGNSNIKFDELTPIAFIENTFKYNNSITTHHGLAFVGLMQKNPKGYKNIDIAVRNINDRFLFTNKHNEVIFELTKDYIKNYKVDNLIVNERTIAKRIIRNKANGSKEEFLKKNNISLTNYTKFKRKIVEDVKRCSPTSIMDIACGLDELIYDFVKSKTPGSKKINLFANDVVLDYITNYHSHHDKFKAVHFSNFNAIEANFKNDSFDVLICKNLLHHISRDDTQNLIKNLMRISKNVVIVEILCYDEQNETGKNIHKNYYQDVLKETKNKNYLGYNEMVELLKSCQCEISTEEKIETENGEYGYFWVKKPE